MGEKIEEIAKEEWAKIDGYGDGYEVSNLGRVRSFKKDKENGMILSQYRAKRRGHMMVSLRDENNKQHTCSVHRLVARAFIDPTIKKNDRNTSIHHIDGNPSNNVPSNLRIMTNAEHQSLHKSKYPKEKVCVICGKTYAPYPSKRKEQKTCSKECHQKLRELHGKNYKIPILQLSLDGELINRWDSATDVRKAFGFFETNIVKCCRGKSQTYKGYRWAYAEGDAK